MSMREAEFLPDEITIDILFRLPLKSIGLFRCVSKHWHNFLSDPQFIKSYSNIHDHKQQEHAIFVSTSNSLYTITFNSQNGFDGISRKLNFHQLPDNWYRIVGCCNSFVLVVDKDDIQFLINPTTLKYHKIPNFDLAFPATHSFTSSFFGLGYDFATDDYKVVGPVQCIRGGLNRTYFDIYSVKKCVWRIVERSPFDLHVNILPGLGIFVNGAMHWLVRKHFCDSFMIIAFDLSEDKFFKVPTPDTDNVKIYKLEAFRGSLCLFAHTEEKNIDVWMMKEYGVEESWTKFIVPNSIRRPKPLCFMSDNDVVLHEFGEQKLIVYDMKEDQWRNLKLDGIDTKFRSTGTFTESLVSPTFGEET